MGEKLFVLDREIYLSMLKSGKIGGEDRQLRINSVRFEGGFALAAVTLSGGKFQFEENLVLYQSHGDWQVIQNASVANPAK